MEVQQFRRDGLFGWLVVLGACLAMTCTFGVSKSSGVFLIYFVDEFNTTWSESTVIFSAQRIPHAASALFFSFLAERFEHRPIVMCGAATLVIGSIASYFATSIYFLYVSFGVINGLGSAMVINGSIQIIPKYFDKKISLASGFTYLGAGIGPLVVPQILLLAVDAFGIRGAFLILAGFQAQIFISAFLMRPVTKFISISDPCQEDAAKSSGETSGSCHLPPALYVRNSVVAIGQTKKTEFETGLDHDIKEPRLEMATIHGGVVTCPSTKSTPETAAVVYRRYKACLSNSYTLLYYCGYFASATAASCWLAFQQGYVKDSGITSTNDQILLTSIAGFVEVVTRLTLPFAIQVNFMLPYRWHQLSCVIMAVLSLSYTFVSQYWLLCICSAVQGLCWSIAVLVIVPSLKEIVGITLTGPAIGLCCIPSTIVYVIVQICSAIRDWTGSFVYVYYVIAVLQVFGVCCLEMICYARRKNFLNPA